MSEHIDEILADVAGAVADRATAPGAQAARRRGRQRRTRRQVAATAFSLVLFGLVGALAVTAIRGDGGALAPVTAGSAAGPTGVAPTAGVGTDFAPAPGRYVAGAWLSGSRLPYAGAITWQVNPQVLGTDLHGAVQLVLPGSAFFDASVDGFGTYCSIPALADEAVADQVESFDGPVTGSSLPSTPGSPATVSQSTVFYRSQRLQRQLSIANVEAGRSLCGAKPPRTCALALPRRSVALWREFAPHMSAGLARSDHSGVSDPSITS